MTGTGGTRVALAMAALVGGLAATPALAGAHEHEKEGNATPVVGYSGPLTLTHSS